MVDACWLLIVVCYLNYQPPTTNHQQYITA